MSELHSSKSIEAIKDNKSTCDNNNNSTPLNKNKPIVPSQKSIKMEILQFKDEILKEIKIYKKSITERNNSQISIISEKLKSYDKKISSLNEKITELSEKIIPLNNIQNNVSSLMELKDKSRDNLLTMEIKFNQLEKEVKNDIFRIDNCLSDSVIYPGMIGKACKFKTFHQMLDYLLTQASQTITYREKNSLDLNTYKKKLESICQLFQNQKDNILNQSNSMINKKLYEIEEKFKNLMLLYDERLSGTRAENAEYIKNMQGTFNTLKNEITEIQNLKGRIFEEIKSEGKILRHENEITQSIFFGYKKEFNLLKEKFTQLGDFIKDVRFRVNLGQEVKRREFHRISNIIDFSKTLNIEKDGTISENNNYDINNELNELNKIREFNENNLFNMDFIKKNKNITSRRRATLNTSNFIKFSPFLNNINGINTNKSGRMEFDRKKSYQNNINKNEAKNLSSIDSNSNELNEENEKNRSNKKINDNKIENIKYNSVKKNEEKDTNTNFNTVNTNDKKRKSLSVRSILEDSRNKKIKIDKNKINFKNEDKTITNNIIIEDKNENNSDSKLQIINKNINISSPNVSIKDKNISKNIQEIGKGSLEEKNNNNKRNIQTSNLTKKIYNGIMNNKEENKKNDVKSKTKRLDSSSPKKEKDKNNNINLIESKKNSKIYDSQKMNNIKNYNRRTQSALHGRLPNINNKAINNIKITNKKQQTIVASNSSNDIYNSKTMDNNIVLDINSFALSNTHNQNLYKKKNNKKNNDINDPIFYAPKHTQFRASKILTNLSPNVQILKYGVNPIKEYNLSDKHNQVSSFNKNYLDNGSNKKPSLNNTIYYFHKPKYNSEKNEAKEIQGMIYNLQNYIKGYNSSFIKQNELKEEKKKLSKNLSYYKIKGIVNDNHHLNDYKDYK